MPASKAAAQAATVADVVAATAVASAPAAAGKAPSAAGNSSAAGIPEQWAFNLPDYSALNMSVSGLLGKVLGQDTIAKMQGLLQSAGKRRRGRL